MKPKTASDYDLMGMLYLNGIEIGVFEDGDGNEDYYIMKQSAGPLLKVLRDLIGAQEPEHEDVIEDLDQTDNVIDLTKYRNRDR